MTRTVPQDDGGAGVHEARNATAKTDFSVDRW
jgi:hypothetical protein